MTYNEYSRLCQKFRKEIEGVKFKTKAQQRKAVDLMALAKRMGDHGSSMRIVGCSRDSMKLWRSKIEREGMSECAERQFTCTGRAESRCR